VNRPPSTRLLGGSSLLWMARNRFAWGMVWERLGEARPGQRALGQESQIHARLFQGLRTCSALVLFPSIQSAAMDTAAGGWSLPKAFSSRLVGALGGWRGRGRCDAAAVAGCWSRPRALREARMDCEVATGRETAS